MNRAALVDRNDSCLGVIDVQENFLAKLPLHERSILVARILWLVKVAARLDIPILATAEDMNRNGPLVPALATALPPQTHIHNKMVFGLTGQDDIRAAATKLSRRSFVLTGLETDVCIAQSALGLAAAGFDVTVIADACGSPPPHHHDGIERLRDAGIRITTTKGLFYEWIRDLETYRDRVTDLVDEAPAGLTL
ncbi:MAG: isochorismatase family protein [Rhizobiales bacterium]|nr:isochorismatase family protein [Hyphomicrobiales bacterium]